MNNLIRNHPRTLLAGALSAALMLAAGGVMAQETTQDHDATTHENQTQTQDQTRTQRQDDAIRGEGTAQEVERDSAWYQTMEEQVDNSQGGTTQNDREPVREHADTANRNHDHDRDSGMLDRDSDQPVNDTWITTKVKASLLADSDVAGLDVEVETVNGVVRLSGDVESQAQLDRAVEIARDIEGVSNVESSDLHVAVGTD